MTRLKLRIIAGTLLVLMAAASLLLSRAQSGRRLGNPGLKLADLPLPGEDGRPLTTNSIDLPERILDFTSKVMPIQKQEYDWLPRDTTYGRRTYTAADGFQIYVSGVLMGTDRTSIHKPEFCLPSQGFQIQRHSKREIAIARPHPYALPVTRLDALQEQRLPDGTVQRIGAVYVYWFVSDTRLSNDHLQRMWWLACDLVKTGELQRWAYIGCLAACPPGAEDAAYRRLEQFVQAAVPEFQLTTGSPSATAGAPLAARTSESR